MGKVITADALLATQPELADYLPLKRYAAAPTNQNDRRSQCRPENAATLNRNGRMVLDQPRMTQSSCKLAYPRRVTNLPRATNRGPAIDLLQSSFH